jgi:hypothetical protein
LVLVLRALDAHVPSGASWKTHDLRDRTIRLVRTGLHLMRVATSNFWVTVVDGADNSVWRNHAPHLRHPLTATSFAIVAPDRPPLTGNTSEPTGDHHA